MRTGRSHTDHSRCTRCMPLNVFLSRSVIDAIPAFIQKISEAHQVFLVEMAVCRNIPIKAVHRIRAMDTAPGELVPSIEPLPGIF